VKKIEKAQRVLVVYTVNDRYAWEEMENLVETAGGEVVDYIVYVRSPNPAYYLGKGKLEKLKKMVEYYEAEVVVFDTTLTPSQQHNLQDYLDTRVIDRVELILDIFAQHATTREAKLQVELAQLQYELPRLVGLGKILSRLGGGIGTRGPGETKLEVDRRRILKRIAQVKRELKEITIERKIQRKERLESGIPIVSLVGYTNAGKSTLLKILTDAQVYIADKLFATLSPKSRRSKLPSGREVIFIDTVGFVERLPHALVESFKSTLEEIIYSSLIVVVCDAHARSRMEKHLKVVDEVLQEIGAASIPKILALNKIDLLDADELQVLQKTYSDAVPISARYGIGISKLLDRIEKAINREEQVYELTLPLNNLEKFLRFRNHVTVISEKYNEKVMSVKFICSPEVYRRIAGYETEVRP